MLPRPRRERGFPSPALLPRGALATEGSAGNSAPQKLMSRKGRCSLREKRKEPREAGQGTVAVGTYCPLPGEAGAQGPCGTWSQQVAPSEIPEATSSEKGHEAPKREAGWGGGQAHEINTNSRWLVRCSENHQTLGSDVYVPSPSQGSRAAPKIAARRPLSGRTPSDSLSTTLYRVTHQHVRFCPGKTQSSLHRKRQPQGCGVLLCRTLAWRGQETTCSPRAGPFPRSAADIRNPLYIVSIPYKTQPPGGLALGVAPSPPSAVSRVSPS